jgi:MFS family permease
MKLAWKSGTWLSLTRCFAGLFAISMASAVVIPSFVVHLRDNLAIAGVALGLMLGVKSLLMRAFGVLGGYLSDRIGRRPIIVGGMLCEVAGFALLGFASSSTAAAGAVLVLGVGGMYGPALAAYIFDAAGEEQRKTVSTWIQTLSNVAFAAGPSLLPLFSSPLHVFRFAAIISLLGTIVLLGLPRKEASTKRSMDGLNEIWRIPALPRVLAFTLGFSAIYTVFNSVMALEAKRLHGDTGLFLFFTANALFVIFFTVLINKAAARRMGTWATLGVGMLFFSAGIAGMAFAHTRATLLITSIVFTVGEIMVASPMQALVAGLTQKYRGVMLGVNAAVGGVGGFTGNFFGATLYEAGRGQEVKIQGEGLFFIGWALLPLLVAGGVCRGTDDHPAAKPKESEKSQPTEDERPTEVPAQTAPNETGTQWPPPIPVWRPPVPHWNRPPVVNPTVGRRRMLPVPPRPYAPRSWGPPLTPVSGSTGMRPKSLRPPRTIRIRWKGKVYNLRITQRIDLSKPGRPVRWRRKAARRIRMWRRAGLWYPYPVQMG